VAENALNADTVDEIVKFWFEELSPEAWYKADEKRDGEIRQRFVQAYDELKSGVPARWLETPKGYLAAILALDQFPRNMFRGDPKAFAADVEALGLAKRAIAEGVDMRLPPDMRAFIYLPFQHAEDKADQASSVELFTALGNPNNLDFALRHKAIIDRFGRFPHRNAILGRESTEEESSFLKEPGSSF
jgi:uncharacterized protein (DUF924 family)